MTPDAEESSTGSFQDDGPPLPYRPPAPLNQPSTSVPDIKATSDSPSSHHSGSDLPRPESVVNPGPSTFSTAQRRSASRSASSSTNISSTAAEWNAKVKDSIVSSFAPCVSVYASSDVNDFVKQKGFDGGLCALLRPFGENVQGKVIIRDSVGGSRAWDDFGVKFCKTGPLTEVDALSKSSWASPSQPLRPQTQGERGIPSEEVFEELLNQYLKSQNTSPASSPGKTTGNGYAATRKEAKPSSPLFLEYVRRLVSSRSMVPYEKFAHPVACLIAVSSRNPAPIEALRHLYAQSGRGNLDIPSFVGTEYLRYYVLVHDEEKDDITKSTALYDMMKRHFGLHCHLLRMTSSQCVMTDDDSVPLPPSVLQSAGEELAELRERDLIDIGTTEPSVSESDAAAINVLIREMVTQSIVPFMESRVMTWNDQVASRRRGISGRFMSLSKRWTAFGSSKANAASSDSSGNAGSSNYNAQMRFYPPESPEALMRQLADYAVMLRDWKLASSTYDFVRSDFSHDKAWAYYAAANEMSAITSLLQTTSQSRPRGDAIDQWLDTAVYSYVTRCSDPMGATRCLVAAAELLHARGPSTADMAAKWVGRMLELGILGPLAQTLMAERIADYYAARNTGHSLSSSPRQRQVALWNTLAALSWTRLDRASLAQRRIAAADQVYRYHTASGLPFESMQPLWKNLRHAARDSTDTRLNGLDSAETANLEDNPPSIIVQEDHFDPFVSRPRSMHADLEGFVASSFESVSAAEGNSMG